MGSVVPRPRAVPVREAPLVPGWPLLGNALDAVGDPCRFFLRGYRAVGPVFRMRYPGRELLVLAGPEANALLARESELFDPAATYARVTREVGTTRLPNAVDGEPHRALRRLLAPSLSSQALEPHVPALHQAVRAVAKGLPKGGRVPVPGLLEPLVTELVARATAGRPAPAGLFRDVRRYGTLMGAIGVGGAAPEWVLYTPPVRGSRRRLDAFLAEALAHHRVHPPGDDRPPDLLDALLAAAERDPDRIDPATLAGLALLPLKNAGIYLARMLGFVLYEVFRDRDLLERLRAEVDPAGAAGPPSLEALRGCRTLQGVMLEGLRLWPMAIALPRVVAEPFEFAGHQVPAGETLYFAAPVTHFLDDCFPEPDRFDPDRYGTDRSEHRRPHAWAPFGLGPHACLARGFSLAIGSVVLWGLVRRMELRVEPPGLALKVRAVPSPVPEARFAVTVLGERPGVTALPPEPGAPVRLVDLPTLVRRRLDADLRTEVLPAGAEVFRQGDRADRFYLLLAGAVEVRRSPPGAATAVVARLGPGEAFGEMGLLQDLPRSATVRVTGDGPAEVLSVGREAFAALAVEGDLVREELVRLVRRRASANALAAALPTLDPATLARAGADAVPLEAAAGEVLIRQGDRADRFYVLLDGRVEVLAGPPGGAAPFVVATLDGVDFFGEIGLLEGRPRTATVRVAADGPARLLALGAEAFAALIAGSKATRRELSMVAAARLVERLRQGG